MASIRSISILLTLTLTINTYGQEIITGAMNNPALTSPDKKHLKSSQKGASVIELPFYDDFSNKKPYPNPGLWADRYVFINNTFSTDQPTMGVATFDALDENGNLYGNATAIPFAADTLTSLAVNLAYAPSDSLYLSFFYEPGGIADLPETNDSLTLEFYSPAETRWHSIWRAKGGTKTGFRRVMICIKDPRYLQNGFRFRFTNYASLSGIVSDPAKAGNADEWNLDCVSLAANRNINDTVMRDVAFTLPVRSLLNNYESMPYEQYKNAVEAEMGPGITLHFRNNDTQKRKVERKVIITDVYKNAVTYDSTYGSYNYRQLSDTSEFEATLYKFSLTTKDSASFLVKSILANDYIQDPAGNDTILYYQTFSNYFAYDDGSKEAGYGINGEGADNAMAALRYRSYMADSVAGISICFNDAYNNANRNYFYPVVWADNNGKPGDILATGDEALARTTEANNGFVTFSFKKAVKVNGYFWIGWKQTTDTYLNAGLDLNTLPNGRQYYWINGNWYQSSAPGTLLMRAVMKGPGTTTSSDDGNLTLPDGFSLYPNPARDNINISVPDGNPDEYSLVIYNLAGSAVLYSRQLSNTDITTLAAGFYFAVVKTSAGKTAAIIKFIKSK